MSKTHPNLAIKSLADLRQRKAQLHLEIIAAKQAALGSAKPLQHKGTAFLIEKAAPLALGATALALIYRFWVHKAPPKTTSRPPEQENLLPWKQISQLALPLLKMALPTIQAWYKNRQQAPNKPPSSSL